MTSKPGHAPLPPGTSGLPLVGETLRFLRDPYGFLSERIARHGPVFRTHLLGKPAAVIAGSVAGEVFIDGARVERAGSQPANVFRLFAGPSVPHLDGVEHQDRKEILLAAFGRDAVARYLPAIERRITRALDGFSGEDEVALLAALKRLAVEGVAEDMMSVTAPARLEALHGLYEAFDPAFAGLPIPLPGTAYTRGLTALDRILAIFDEVVLEHRASPKDDGLSRILAHCTASGAAITDEQVRRELHHLVLAGRVVYTHLAGAVLHLARHPEVRERAAAEVRAAKAGPLTPSVLRAMPYLASVLAEIKRVTPVVPAMFGVAKQDLELHGHRIPKGWMILFALHATHQLADVYPDPERFDPGRFTAGELAPARGPHAFCPHGPGRAATSHHCAGTDYATTFALAFMALLLERCSWELVDPSPELTWRRMTPDPASGLRARVRRLARETAAE